MISKLKHASITYNSFLPSTSRDWNNLLAEAKQLSFINSFKYYLKKDKPSVPKYHYYGSRKAQILHTRLRTGCSSLNLDRSVLKKYNWFTFM